MSGSEITDFYTADKNMRAFVDIIRDSEVYPLITDNNNVVLSLPPLINGDHSKIKLTTKNVFVEMTATDHTKANIALNTVISMFSQVIFSIFLLIFSIVLNLSL
jgi:phenylalanyl-tRNA synthetase beta chain